MIRSIVRTDAKITGKEEVVIVPLFEDDKRLSGAANKLDGLCRSAISKTLRKGHFQAGEGKTLLLALNLPRVPDHVLLVGMGKRGKADAESVANAGGAASNELRNRGYRTGHLWVGDDVTLVSNLHAFLKGFLLAQYGFKISKEKPQRGTGKLVVLSDDRSVGAAMRTARVVAEGTARVRDLVNTPSEVMTPARMSEEARVLAKEHGMRCKILRQRELEAMGMGAVLAVARGSREEPRLISLHYNKGKSVGPRVCLVGKGVTFDSGGLSIKPWMNMNEMKGDMAGGALVLSTLAAAAKLKLPLEIIGLIPCVENMPDGNAFRPGDVITTYTGKTIEVLSTDAEGRLILSDALAYGCEFEPDVIIDVATLTGAVVIALGTRIAGVMGNNQEHITRLIDAGKRTGEPVWQLPLDDSFLQLIKGEVSDYKNYGGRDGSTITAAALLREFVGRTPWVHVDIAGTFWTSSNRPYQPKGATGYGVDLFLNYLESLVA